MDGSMQTVVFVLADGFGLSELSVHEAMERDETVSKRIERIAEGNGSDVGIKSLNADVKASLQEKGTVVV